MDEVWAAVKAVVGVGTWWEDLTVMDYARVARLDPGQAAEALRVAQAAGLALVARMGATYTVPLVTLEGCFAERNEQVDRLLDLGCQVGWQLTRGTVWLADRNRERLHESARRLKVSKDPHPEIQGEEIPRLELRGEGKWANIQEVGQPVHNLAWYLPAAWDLHVIPGKVHAIPEVWEANRALAILKLQARYPDTFLWFRLGDFYEAYLQQAETLAPLLDLTLTHRTFAGGGESDPYNGQWPMVGFPYHALDRTLSRLVKQGYHTALVDVTPPLTTEEVQLRQLLPDPPAKGLNPETLSTLSNLPLHTVQATLVTLELKVQAKRNPGNLFTRLR